MVEEQLGAASLRTAFGTVPSGVVAVCGVDAAGTRTGMAVSTFIPVSLDPPLVGLSVQVSSRTWPVLRAMPALGISVLSSGHGPAARQLAAREGDRFVGLTTHIADSGAVYIDGAPTRFECSIEQEVPAGDHLLVTLRVHSITVDLDAAPLIFHRSAFAGVVPLSGAGLLT
ncbi:flavin reductase family protein [Dactylosporangium sp. CA-092794]|uniref:flavin reductase family protein n=1 Tax=Dactylosporangium sp. CA-092794 TaxID=3239929 RepID=UPI003D913E98